MSGPFQPAPEFQLPGEKKKWIRPATTARLIRGDGEGGTRTRSRRTALARAIMALAYQLFNFVHTHFLILFGIPACLK